MIHSDLGLGRRLYYGLEKIAGLTPQLIFKFCPELLSFAPLKTQDSNILRHITNIPIPIFSIFIFYSSHTKNFSTCLQIVCYNLK